MNKKKYILVASVLILLTLLLIFLQNNKRVSLPAQPKGMVQQSGPHFIITDDASSPHSPNALTNGEVIRETDAFKGSSLQRFAVKNPIDNTTRELFETNEPNVSFEPISQVNWSSTNRFLFVYVDYPKRRDVVFIKTDGKFTNGQFYLHSTGLYPNMNVTSAKWLDSQTLKLYTTNIQTNAPQNYIVNFDDDTGIVTPE